VIAAGALLGELTALLQSSAAFKGAASQKEGHSKEGRREGGVEK